MSIDKITKEKFDAIQNFSDSSRELVTHFLGSMREQARRKISFEDWYIAHLPHIETINTYLGELSKHDVDHSELKSVYDNFRKTSI